MEDWMISNLVTVGLLAAMVGCVFLIRRSRLWSEAAVELWKRRPIAILCVSLYLAVAILDSIFWVGGVDAGEDVVSAHEAKSVIDRLFADARERSSMVERHLPIRVPIPWAQTSSAAMWSTSHSKAFGLRS